MREKGERARFLREGRKGGVRLLIQTESVYLIQGHPYILARKERLFFTNVLLVEAK